MESNTNQEIFDESPFISSFMNAYVEFNKLTHNSSSVNDKVVARNVTYEYGDQLLMINQNMGNSTKTYRIAQKFATISEFKSKKSPHFLKLFLHCLRLKFCTVVHFMYKLRIKVPIKIEVSFSY